MRALMSLTALLAAFTSAAGSACSRQHHTEPTPASPSTQGASDCEPALNQEPGFETMLASSSSTNWTVLRVAGHDVVEVESADGAYRFRGMLIDTPLPVGYPRPTPPGAIELKKYPGVRRAEVGGSIHPDLGMNFTFFPLFNHIKRRDIAMTSPVEMDYSGKGPEAGKAPDKWTMSFLYREPSNGELGQDRNVRIVDTAPATVISTGIRGRYSWEKLQQPLETLGRWLAEHPEWERAGDARALYYNGPDRRTADLWGEAQIPIRPAGLNAEPHPDR